MKFDRKDITAPLDDHPQVRRQIALMEDLAAALDPDFIGIHSYHTSKSIRLPVATYGWDIRIGGAPPEYTKAVMMVRDNFHDLSLFVKCPTPLTLPLDLLYEQRDFEWYKLQIERCRNYCYSGWSEEELDDYRILRVHGSSKVLNAKVKDRWMNRMVSTDWYHLDWSSARIVASGPVPFDDRTLFYPAPFSYGEGIPDTTGPYTGPCVSFTQCYSDWDELQNKALKILMAVRSHLGQINDRNQ